MYKMIVLWVFSINPKREHDTKMMPWQGFKKMPTQCFYEHHEHEPHSHGYADCINRSFEQYKYKSLSRGGRLKELLPALNTVSCVEFSKPTL